MNRKSRTFLTQTLFGLIFILVTINAIAQVPVAQKQALIDFYMNTDGDNWENNTGWLLGDPCLDQWHGVSCDASDNITALELQFNNIFGTIPSNFSDLNLLVKLDLGYYCFLTAVPDVIGTMTQLEELILPNCNIGINQFPTPIPSWVSNLTQLKILNLSENEFFGAIPENISQLTQLRELDLSLNYLEGTLPNGLYDLNLLERINLWSWNNMLTGNVSPNIKQLNNLTHLLISSEKNMGQIPNEIGQLPSLIELDLTGFSGSFPSEVAKLSNLLRLGLVGDFAPEPFPTEILSLDKLQALSLQANITGSIPTAIAQLTQLTVLDLSNNALTGSIPTQLNSIPNLKYVILNNNLLSGNYPSWFHLSNTLEYLNIRNNGIQGVILDAYFNQRYISLYADYNALKVESDLLLDDFDFDCYCDWKATQTTEPTELQTQQLDDNHLLLSWNPISFDHKNGGYQVWIKADGDSEYSLIKNIRTKSANKTVISGLTPGQSYDIYMRSYSYVTYLDATTVPPIIYSDNSVEITHQQQDLQPSIQSLEVLLDSYQIPSSGSNDYYDFILKNNGQTAVTSAQLNVFGHNPPGGYIYTTFGVGCIETSSNASCPVLNSFDYNFLVDVDLPVNSWLKFRVYTSTFLAVDKIDLPYHSILVLPSSEMTDDNYADNQIYVRLYDYIFENDFE
jgi:Leucine-rich repeat (LRR) protein